MFIIFVSFLRQNASSVLIIYMSIIIISAQHATPLSERVRPRKEEPLMKHSPDKRVVKVVSDAAAIIGSVRALAKMLEVHHSSVYRWEDGTSEPSASQYLAMTEVIEKYRNNGRGL